MLTRDYEALGRSPYIRPSHATPPMAMSPLAREISPGSALATAPLTTLTAPNYNSALEVSSLLSALVETLPKGLIVLSTDRDIVYWNQAARRLCQELSSTQRYSTLLPTIVTELSRQVVETDSVQEPVILDHETPDCCLFRLSASWLTGAMSPDVSLAFNQQTYILVTIEDRNEVLRQDIQLEQKKFHLTNREAEVWLLLKREYSYQAIANTLHISLNTVKTHIRNIHAKRHPYQSLPA